MISKISTTSKFIAVLALLSACGSSGGNSTTVVSNDDSSELGNLELRLSSFKDGVEYRLRDAVFHLSGGGRTDAGMRSQYVLGEDFLGQERIRVPLERGFYFITLLDGWRMENASTAPPETVPAILFSRIEQQFSIYRGSTANVTYEFGVNGTELDFGGKLDIRIQVRLASGADAGVPFEPQPDAGGH